MQQSLSGLRALILTEAVRSAECRVARGVGLELPGPGLAPPGPGECSSDTRARPGETGETETETQL